MSTDFVINFYFKNDWVIAVWKFRLWITFQQFSPYICQIDPKLKFSNGYNSFIFKVKIFDKISRHSELPREFKNAKIFQKKFWEDFLKNIWKSAIFKNIFLIIKNRRFSNIFLKIFLNFFLKYFCSFELARQFSMSTDFFINFDFKNDWIIAVWKFQLWISSQHKMWRGSVCAPYMYTMYFCTS